MTHDLEQVYKRAYQLNELWELDALEGEDALITFPDERMSVVEHVCHELAHAYLLKIRFEIGLSTRVANRLADYDDLGALNEVKTFSVVIGVLQKLDIPVHDGDMRDALHAQVNKNTWPQFMIHKVWRGFETTTTHFRAVRRISRLLLQGGSK